MRREEESHKIHQQVERLGEVEKYSPGADGQAALRQRRQRSAGAVTLHGDSDVRGLRIRTSSTGPRIDRCASRCALACGVVAVQTIFWLTLICGAALHVEVTLGHAGEEAEPFRLGEVLWQHRRVLWNALSGHGEQPWWQSPELQDTWRAFQPQQQQWRTSSGSERKRTLWHWALGKEESVDALLAELRIAPEVLAGSSEWGGPVPPRDILSSSYRAAALELHSDRLPPGSSADDHARADESFRRLHGAYKQLVALRRRQETSVQ